VSALSKTDAVLSEPDHSEPDHSELNHSESNHSEPIRSEPNHSESEHSDPDLSHLQSAVLIDTNGFMIPVQFGIDIFSELRRLGFSQFLTVSAVVFELERLTKAAKGNDKIAARVALQLSEKCQVIDNLLGLPSFNKVSKYADDVITAAAVKYSLAVLTNDAGLRQKLIKNKVRVISMRQTKRLDFITTPSPKSE